MFETIDEQGLLTRNVSVVGLQDVSLDYSADDAGLNFVADRQYYKPFWGINAVVDDVE